MEVLILNKNYEQVGLFEHFQSLIWDERFYEAGAFELYCPYSEHAYKLFRKGNRVKLIADSEMVCTIDHIKLESDPDDGRLYLTVSGRDVLYLLNRRIIYEFNNFVDTKAADVVKKLITENAVNTADNSTSNQRRLPRLRYVEKSVKRIDVTGCYQGQTLHDAVSAICRNAEMGVHVLLNETENVAEISLYNGTARTEGMEDVQPIVLSTDYGTLNGAEWSDGENGIANVSYVGGDGSGPKRIVVSTESTSYRGEERCEMWVDASDIRNEDGEMSEAQYKTALQNRGTEKVAALSSGRTFDAEMNPDVYTYRQDYNLGDLVTVHTEEITATTRVTEVVRTWEGGTLHLDVSLEIVGWWYDDDVSNIDCLLDEYGDILTDENNEALEDE